jgi:hypothetical protein
MKDWLLKLRQRRDGNVDKIQANSTDRSNMTREEVEADIESIREKRTKELKARGQENWDKGNTNFTLDVSPKEKEMSDEDFLKRMQEVRKAAVSFPSSILDGMPSQSADMLNRTQYSKEHQARIARVEKRLDAVAKEETPRKWATDMNRELVTEGIIVDNRAALKMRNYEMEMRARHERHLAREKPVSDLTR